MANMAGLAGRRRKKPRKGTDDYVSRAQLAEAMAVPEASSTGRKRKAESMQTLEWRDVDMPDTMGADMEGFMGLEEVTGVSIEYEQAPGNARIVKYKKADEKDTVAGSKQALRDSGTAAKSNKSRAKTKSAASIKPDTVPKPDAKAKRDAKGDAESKKPHSGKQTPMLTLSGNSFSSLADMADIDLPGWQDIKLPVQILGALQTLGYREPTTIQRLAIPDIIEGADIVGKAATGSGKTLAFGIPIVERIITSGEQADKRTTSAVVLAPTRELARQIQEHLAQAAQNTDVSIMTATGGLAVEKQRRLLAHRPDIIVATPGRLWELISSGQGTRELLEGIRFFVLDEADRLLQKGHFDEIKEIIDVLRHSRGSLRKQRQTLVFSATFADSLKANLHRAQAFDRSRAGQDAAADPLGNLLAQLDFRSKTPKFVDADPEHVVAAKVHEAMVECAKKEKDLVLYYFLLRFRARTLVFVNNVDDAKRLGPFLTNLNIPTFTLHAQLDQKKRLHTLEKFARDSKGVLVATDVAARGLDIPEIDHVVHYNVPHTADMYVHRSGRTARGSHEGVALVMIAPNEAANFRRMLDKIGRQASDFIAFQVDLHLVDQLRQRVKLAQRITDSTKQSGKRGREEKWLKEFADDLGVDLDSVDLQDPRARKSQENDSSAEQVRQWRAELSHLLTLPIRTRFSTKYLTSGAVNMAQALVDGTGHDTFIGTDAKSALQSLTRGRA